MKQRFKYITDHDSIFIQVGDDEMFRNRKRLKEAGIITVGDIIEYLGVDAEYILADNVEVNKDKKISEIDTLELYSSLGDKNKEYIKKLGDKYGYETG